MRRRDFLAALAGAAATTPLSSRAQQGDRVVRIGVLMHSSAEEPEPQARLAAFVQGLQEAGWSDGRNAQIDVRWSPVDQARLRKDAVEVVALHPDIILAGVGATVPALQQASRSIPIVFAQAIDPVGAGYVDSLNRPGGNATGFVQFEYELAGKWLELLKEIAPGVTRALVLRESGAAGVGQWAIIQAVSHSLGVEMKPIALEIPASEIEQAISAFAQQPNSGLVVVVSAAALTHRDLLIALAAKHRLPTVYPYRAHVAAGGLISYGADINSQYKRAAGYVDRILKGENPANMPVQAPTKYNLVVNLRTARTLGLSVPPALLARADEVIE